MYKNMVKKYGLIVTLFSLLIILSFSFCYVKPNEAIAENVNHTGYFDTGFRTRFSAPVTQAALNNKTGSSISFDLIASDFKSSRNITLGNTFNNIAHVSHYTLDNYAGITFTFYRYSDSMNDKNWIAAFNPQDKVPTSFTYYGDGQLHTFHGHDYEAEEGDNRTRRKITNLDSSGNLQVNPEERANVVGEVEDFKAFMNDGYNYKVMYFFGDVLQDKTLVASSTPESQAWYVVLSKPIGSSEDYSVLFAIKNLYINGRKGVRGSNYYAGFEILANCLRDNVMTFTKGSYNNDPTNMKANKNTNIKMELDNIAVFDGYDLDSANLKTIADFEEPIADFDVLDDATVKSADTIEDTILSKSFDEHKKSIGGIYKDGQKLNKLLVDWTDETGLKINTCNAGKEVMRDFSKRYIKVNTYTPNKSGYFDTSFRTRFSAPVTQSALTNKTGSSINFDLISSDFKQPQNVTLGKDLDNIGHISWFTTSSYAGVTFTFYRYSDILDNEKSWLAAFNGPDKVPTSFTYYGDGQLFTFHGHDYYGDEGDNRTRRKITNLDSNGNLQVNPEERANVVGEVDDFKAFMNEGYSYKVMYFFGDVQENKTLVPSSSADAQAWYVVLSKPIGSSEDYSVLFAFKNLYINGREGVRGSNYYAGFEIMANALEDNVTDFTQGSYNTNPKTTNIKMELDNIAIYDGYDINKSSLVSVADFSESLDNILINDDKLVKSVGSKNDLINSANYDSNFVFVGDIYSNGKKIPNILVDWFYEQGLKISTCNAPKELMASYAQRSVQSSDVTISFKDEVSGAIIDSITTSKWQPISAPQIEKTILPYTWNQLPVNGVNTDTTILGNVDFEAVKSQLNLNTLGASIRLTGNVGMRFMSSIDKAMLNKLYNVYGQENVTVGTLIIPSALVPAEGLDITTVKVSNCVAKNWWGDLDNNSRFTAVLTDIPAQFNSTDITVKAYVKIVNGESVNVLYGSEVTRNIYNIALQAYNDRKSAADDTYLYLVQADNNYSPYTAEQLDFLKNTYSLEV